MGILHLVGRSGDRGHRHHALGVQQIVDLLEFGIDRQTDIGHDVFPRNGRSVVRPEVLHRTDFDAEHDVADTVVPVVERLLDRADAQHDVVVHGPFAAGPELPDIVVETRAAHLVAHAFGVDVLVVEVEDHLVLAPLQHILQARNPVGRDFAVAVHEVQAAQFVVGVVGDEALARGRAVDRQVVHEHHDAVLGEAEVDFEEGRHQRQRLFARLDAVFGIAGHHAAAVAADDHVARGIVGEIDLQLLDRIDLHGVQPGGLGAGGHDCGAACGQQ